ncbi:alpha/beta hydrolase [Bacteroides caecimuris]|uniref:alpha/beta hydrolase n=1 Tax=Bacteroides caecimuris TaxID=1796613 RepID=UPI00242E7484|nr:alpha/beta hydrolase [Bacteroides caecimuris]
MKKNCFLLLFLLCTCFVQAQNAYRTDKDVPYISGSETDTYRLERCKLDVYYPENKKDFSTIVWFHGGGMEGGSKFIPKELTDQGFAVVAVNYRLSPKAKNPAYIEDAAEAVAWVFKNIEKYGGRKDRIFVSGHSAGGYLTLILAMDKKYMAAYGADADSVAAYLPVSGQTVTHFTIRKERGLPNGIPIIDEFAPVNKARKDTAPVVLITGDKNQEMADRYEENALLASVLKNIGNQKVSLYELQGFDHGQVLGPACYLIVNYVKGFK